jgi:hypothetical protein
VATPDAVVEGLPRGYVLQARSVLEVADGDLDLGVAGVEGVDVGHRPDWVGE